LFVLLYQHSHIKFFFSKHRQAQFFSMLMFGRATIFAQISISSILTETKSYTFFKNEQKSVVDAQQTPKTKLLILGPWPIS